MVMDLWGWWSKVKDSWGRWSRTCGVGRCSRTHGVGGQGPVGLVVKDPLGCHGTMG